MKSLNNVFGKSPIAKNITEFNHFSINSNLMRKIKGGTQPIITDPSTPPPTKISNQI
jgi:hypothetical protein